MKDVAFDGEIANAYGKPLHELAVKEGFTPLAKGAVLKYSAKVTEYETIEEVKAANDWVKDEEVIKLRNTQRRANARQKAMQTTQDEAGLVAPTIENDDQLRLKKMYDLFIANKATPENARQLASAALGIDWTE